MASIWKHPKSRYWTACFRDVSGHQRRASTRETNRKRAQRIADEYEKASRSKRTLKQVQTVLDRLHEELSGARIIRTTVRSPVATWLETKKPETAPATLYFYRNSLGKFLDFLRTRADHPITEVTKQDVVAFRNQVSTRVSAKTTNHGLRAVKSFFKSAREDDVIPEDPASSVKGVQKEAGKEKSVHTLDELRVVLDAADPEWKSMILFGLYTGQRLADVATVRWSNVDLAKGEIRLTTRKTDKVMILPIAAPLRRYLEGLPSTDDGDAPLHPRAFAVVERLSKSGGCLASLSIYWRRLGFGKNKLTDLEGLAGLPSARPPGYLSTVYAGQLPRSCTKPAFRLLLYKA